MTLKLNAQWTDDCCGKKDYDGDILSISTRYWPKGGGFRIFDSSMPQLGLQKSEDVFPNAPPSAHASIMLRTPDAGVSESVRLAEKDFKGDSFEEVKAAVEAWGQEQMDRIVEILQPHFPALKAAMGASNLKGSGA